MRLTDEEMVERLRLCYVATATADGTLLIRPERLNPLAQ
jgi:hypothetical protein